MHLADITVDYLPELYEAEIYCTQRLKELAHKAFPEPDDLEERIAQAQRESGVNYSAEQSQAIREAAGSGLLLITGGPGTGKTTLLNGILNLYGNMQLKCLAAAPTGRGCQAHERSYREEASTIHRLLQAGIDQNTGKMGTFAKDEDNPLKADAYIIVDEMSMVDIQLLVPPVEGHPQGQAPNFGWLRSGLAASGGPGLPLQ